MPTKPAARRLSRGSAVAPKAAGFIAIIRLYVEGVGAATLVWMPVVAAVAGMTIITGNLMAIPQHNIKRLLAYSGIAHIGYMLVGLAAFSSNGIGMVLFYLVAYLFGNMGAFFVVEAVARSENSDEIDAYRGLAQRSPLLALAMLIFLLSLGGIPFVAGFWAKLYVFLAAIDRGHVRPGVPRRRPDRRRALLLPARRAPDVYRSAGADRPHSGTSAPRSRDCHLPPRRRRHGGMARPLGERHTARRRKRLRGFRGLDEVNPSEVVGLPR